MRWVSWSRSAGSSGSYSIRAARAGGIATITCFAVTRARVPMTFTPLAFWAMRFTGVFRATLLPSSAATRSEISWLPPTKRSCWAPSAVWKLRSKVPWLLSFPDAAM